MTSDIEFYGDSISGNCYKLQLAAAQLGKNRFIANDRYSIADIALFAYTHVADEGGFDLTDYPRINAWLDRVTEQPGFVAMKNK